MVKNEPNPTPLITKQIPRTKPNERRTQIRDMMVMHATDSPTTIARILHEKLNVKISPNGVKKHIDKIRADYTEFYYGIAKTVYAETARAEHTQLNELIKMTFGDIAETKNGAQKAMMINALISLFVRRQYVMEDMIMYPAMNPWHGAIDARIKQQKQYDMQTDNTHLT